MEDKISEMYDISRRHNIQVDGITEGKEDTCEDCEKKVLEILKDKIEIEDVTTERSHIVKPDQNNKNNKDKAAPRTIRCKLVCK